MYSYTYCPLFWSHLFSSCVAVELHHTGPPQAYCCAHPRLFLQRSPGVLHSHPCQLWSAAADWIRAVLWGEVGLMQAHRMYSQRFCSLQAASTLNQDYFKISFKLRSEEILTWRMSLGEDVETILQFSCGNRKGSSLSSSRAAQKMFWEQDFSPSFMQDRSGCSGWGQSFLWWSQEVEVFACFVRWIMALRKH